MVDWMIEMKLERTVNGDYVNLEKADSFYVAPKMSGAKWSVFVRIGSQSFELSEHSAGLFDAWTAELIDPSWTAEDNAREAMVGLVNNLQDHKTSVSVQGIKLSIHDIKALQAMRETLEGLGKALIPGENTSTTEEIKDLGTPKKRAPRKAKEQDNG